MNYFVQLIEARAILAAALGTFQGLANGDESIVGDLMRQRIAEIDAYFAKHDWKKQEDEAA